MKDEEIFQEIIVNETDNGTIDKITSKINKQTQANEKLAQSASKVNISNQGSTKKKTNGISAIKGSDNYSPELAAMYDKWAEEDSKKTSKKSSGKKVKPSLSSEEKSAKIIQGSINAANKSIEKLKKSLNFTDLVVKITALSTAVKGVFSFAESGTKIVEENNLFYNQLTNVSKEYGDLEKSATRYYEKAIDYQNKLYEATHLNRVENMKSQGTFFQLFNAQNVGEDLSYRLSESLSNAAIDLSSLFNIDYDQMVEKLKSGIIGNSRPLRELGIDVTEGTMQGILDNLGIDATVEQLTFAEKEVLRYMTILDQVGYAQGDFANTFMQSANQIRVFQNELTTVGQMIGTIFNKLLSNVLYVARGIIMAVEEILTALGSLIGVDWSDTGSTRPLASLGEEVDDVSAGIGGATAKAKEFKKQLMSFDEIHNITPPDSSSGGGGGGVGGLSGLLNSDLSNAIKDWESNFSKIDDEAKRIKDSILKTLGFTKDINGNLKWSISDFWNNLPDWGKNIVRTIQTILAFKLGVKILEMVGNAKKLIGLLTNNPIEGSGLEIGIKSLGTFLSNSWKNFTTLTNGWKNGIENANGSLTKLAIQIVGVASAAQGVWSILDDVKLILDGTVNAADMIPAIILRITQAITGAVAAIMAVSKNVSPLLTVVSTLASVITGIIAGIVESNAKEHQSFNALKKEVEAATEARKKYNEEAKQTRDSTIKEINEGESSILYYKKLKDELMGLVDANGQIKDGNEGRVKFILGELQSGLGLEYTLNGNIIKQYDEYIGKIDKAIQKKKEEIYINAFQDDYTKAMKRSTTAANELSNATQTLQKVENSEEYKKAIEKYDWLKGRLKEAGYEFKETGNKAEDFKKICQLIQQGGTFGWIDDADQGIQGLKVDVDKLNTAWWEVNTGATNGMEDTLKTFEEAKKTHSDCTQSIINDNSLMAAYDQLMTAQMTGDAKQIEAAQINLSTVYAQQSGENVATIERQVSDMIASTNRWVDEQNKAGKQVTDDQKKALDEGVKNVAYALREQTKTVHTLTPDEIQAWKDLSTYSHDIYNEQISQLDPETQTLLNTLTGNVTAEQPQYWDAWSKMAVNAKDKFKQNIKSLPQDQQTTLLAGISTVKGCEQATVEAYGQLSEEGKIEYLGKIKSLPEDQRTKILEMLGEFGKQEGTAGTAAKELADTIQKAINGEELKIGDKQIKVDGKAIDDKIKGAIGSITVPIKGDYKASWHYVPKADGSGDYEYRYFAKGGRPNKGEIFIAREAGAELVGNIGGSTGVMNNIQIITAVAKGVSSAVASVLHDGFTVSIPQDNTVSNVQEQLVNEMRISNEYASQEFKQARPSVSSKYGFTSSGVVGSGTQGLVQMLAQAVEYGMNNANVNVKVEATTDTGVVIKQVSEAMNDYVNQTGQLPFAIPM